MSKTSYWYCPHCREEVDARNVTFQELHDTCGHAVEWIENIDLDCLREMCDAEREQRCVVLPCKVGDTVYEITQDYYAVVDCPYVDSVYVDEIAYTVWDEDDEVQIKLNGYLDIEDLYYTRAEAEAALTKGGTA